MHPFITNLASLKDNEIESKIYELSSKYFMTSNQDVKNQIVMILDSYKEELQARRLRDWEKTSAIKEKGLDKLINIK